MLFGIGYNIGKDRKINEDFYGVLIKNTYSAYIIADGMGGHNAGDVASKLAVERSLAIIDGWNEESIGEDGEHIGALIASLVNTVNREIYIHSIQRPDCYGMGTTLVLCLLYAGRLYYANIGDSRLYGIRNGLLTQLTKDHSLVQDMIDSGLITKEQSYNHPQRNIITRALGTDAYVKADVQYIISDFFDAFMLCTDGLINMVHDNEINKVLSEYQLVYDSTDFDVICNKLVDMANANGGHDNISLIIFKEQIK